jgi:hypothetical protein
MKNVLSKVKSSAEASGRYLKRITPMSKSFITMMAVATLKNFDDFIGVD